MGKSCQLSSSLMNVYMLKTLHVSPSEVIQAGLRPGDTYSILGVSGFFLDCGIIIS